MRQWISIGEYQPQWERAPCHKRSAHYTDKRGLCTR